MKSNAKFFTGLALGLAMSFLFLNVGSLKSESTAVPTPKDQSITKTQTPDREGEFISVQQANEMINSYKNIYIPANQLSSSTTLGGVIGRSNLQELAKDGNDDLIMFRFYMTTNSEGDQQIGLIFYPKAASTNVLRTGTSSFCPTMCDNK